MEIFLIFMGFIGLGLLLLFILIRVAIHWEKKDFNNGVCIYCNKPLHHFDTDSQGGRLYTCENYCCLISVSYDSVDKDFSEDRK